MTTTPSEAAAPEWNRRSKQIAQLLALFHLYFPPSLLLLLLLALHVLVRLVAAYRSTTISQPVIRADEKPQIYIVYLLDLASFLLACTTVGALSYK